MTPTDTLDRLLAAAADAELTETDRVTLAAVLRDDPAAQKAYRDYLLLDALLRWETPPVVPAPVRPRRGVRVAAGAAVAAGVLIAVAVALLVAGPTRDAVARPDVVGEVADWTLAIADAPTPANRRERFRERADALSAELARPDLPADERWLAHALFDRARALSDADDPVAVAEHLDGMAEELHGWLAAHTDADPRRAEAVERHYLRFVERSLSNVRRASAAGPDQARQTRGEKVTERIARRAEARTQKEAERAAKRAGR